MPGVILAVCAGVACFASSSARAAPPDLAAQPNVVRGDEITPAQRAAVSRGLAWLASRQGADGRFGQAGGYGKTPAITALAALAFMESGDLPDRGPHGVVVRKALDAVLADCQPSGLIAAADANAAPMYGHGFATLFLGEVYGMTADEAVKEKLERAVHLIERCQNKEGGWRYMPVPADADISVTICQIMALRAARDGGVKVERDVIDKAVAYVRNCQNPDGGFSYQAHGPGGGGTGSGFARSAAGVAALYYAGVFQGDDLRRGLDYVAQFTPGQPNAPAVPGQPAQAEVEGFYFYGHYYATQAMFLAGGKYWATFYPALRDELIKRQKPSGAWEDNVGEEYATAMALIILQMPNRYLPVFSGKGPGG